jgi:hypothetical protein
MPKGRPKKQKDTAPKKEAKAKKQAKQEIVAPKKRGRPKKVVDTSTEIASETKKEPVVLTQEDMELRREKIRATIPKIDLHKTREMINITKDKDACREHTFFACHRPDIFLDLGCSECSLQNACACPLFDPKRKPDGRAPKLRKFTSAKKSS